MYAPCGLLQARSPSTNYSFSSHWLLPFEKSADPVVVGRESPLPPFRLCLESRLIVFKNPGRFSGPISPDEVVGPFFFSGFRSPSSRVRWEKTRFIRNVQRDFPGPNVVFSEPPFLAPRSHLSYTVTVFWFLISSFSYQDIPFATFFPFDLTCCGFSS